MYCDVPCNVRTEELRVMQGMLAITYVRCTVIPSSSYFPCVPYGSCTKCCTFVMHHVRGVLCGGVPSVLCPCPTCAGQSLCAVPCFLYSASCVKNFYMQRVRCAKSAM